MKIKEIPTPREAATTTRLDEIQRSRRSSSKYNINYAIVDEIGFDEVTENESHPTEIRRSITRAEKNIVAKNQRTKVNSKKQVNTAAENTEVMVVVGASSSIPGSIHSLPVTLNATESASQSPATLPPIVQRLSKLKLSPVFGKKPKSWDNDIEILKLLERFVAAKSQNQNVCASVPGITVPEH